MQYHDDRTSFGMFIAGKRKNQMKKDPESGFSNLLGGVTGTRPWAPQKEFQGNEILSQG